MLIIPNSDYEIMQTKSKHACTQTGGVVLQWCTYPSLEDSQVDHAQDHVEPDTVKHLQRAQQTVVCVVDVGHSNDNVAFKQRAS